MADKETKKSGDPKPAANSTVVTEETKPEQDPVPPAESNNTEPSTPTEKINVDEPSEPEEIPAQESVTKKKDPSPSTHATKINLSKADLSPIWSLLDRIVEMGGDAASLAVQAKALLMFILGDASAPTALKELAPAAPAEDEIAKKISEEVKKQLDAAIKTLPAQRKGLVQPEPEADEVKKTFEGLPPEKKLRVALALQR